MSSNQLPQLLAIVALSIVGSHLLAAQTSSSRDIAGEWVLAIERYGETEYQRMSLTVVSDRLSLDAPGMQLDGTISNGRFELRRRGTGLPITMSGDVKEMSGDLIVADNFGRADIRGRWSATRPRLRPSGAPLDHTFEPSRFPRVYSEGVAPVLHVYPGDTVKTWTVDAFGVDARGVRHSRGGNPLTGPFFIEGALPGDVLVVRLLRVRLNRDTAFSGRSLSNVAVPPRYLLRDGAIDSGIAEWVLDRTRGVARLAKPTDALKELVVPLKPMLGCIGVAPPSRTVRPSGSQGNYGGNLDYNRLVEGTTVYLPVWQPGALLSIGDGHAAQGDGELTGNALETSLDVEFSIDVVRAKNLRAPRAEDKEQLMAMGLGPSLTEALQDATEGMAVWLQNDYGLSAAEAALVMGTVLQYDIAEVVGVNTNVVARISKAALASIRSPNRPQ